MGALVEKGLRGALQGLFQRDRRKAYGVILRDQLVDELEMELDQLCLEFLARQQPVAGHLRFAFAMVQIDRELERIGDYAESVARQALVLCDFKPPTITPDLTELGDVAVHMLHDAMQAFLAQDAELATRTMAVEERANALRNRIMSEIARLSAEQQLSPVEATALSTITRRLERASDQAKNICEEVLYMCTGSFAKHKSAHRFRILFLGTHNSSVTQMAEAIGRGLGKPEFLFTSAGIAPQPIQPRTAEFLRGKGVDLSVHTSKTLEQLPDLAQYQVVVSLGTDLKSAVPGKPNKTLHLTWEIPDVGGPAATKETYERAWAQLDEHIRDLVGAILDEPVGKVG